MYSFTTVSVKSSLTEYLICKFFFWEWDFKVSNELSSILLIILFAFLVFKIIPIISLKVSQIEKNEMNKKLKDNNETNKYGFIIAMGILILLLIIALISW